MSKIIPKFTPDATDFESQERFESILTFVAAGTIAVGAPVIFDDTAGYAATSTVVVAPTGGYYAVGIALTGADAGEPIQVQVRGVAPAEVIAGVNAGEPVFVDSGTAGSLGVGVAGAVTVGVAIEGSGAGGITSVLLLPFI